MRIKTLRVILILTIIVLLLVPALVSGSSPAFGDLGESLPLWYCLPFVGMLLSIALFPLFKPHWWEKNLLNVSIFWSLVFLVPFSIGFGPYEAGANFFEILLLDYLPFIVLLWGLFTVSGGIALEGPISGTPKTNLILLIVGTLLASWVGTTGASMLMIRPLLRANAWREKQAHVVVFFIFLVSNMGGCLTPIGDPPLYLGFLRNVPFFWTMRLAPILLFNSIILFTVFFFLDRKMYNKEVAAGHRPLLSGHKSVLHVAGAHNLIFIAMIVGAVILSGCLSSFGLLNDPNTGEIIGVPFAYGISIPLNNVIQMLIILLAGFLSIRTTKPDIHTLNNFSFGPIKEVACLFVGIFITMSPALMFLHCHGSALGLTEPWQFFWASGALSSFLDNAPTYLVFMTTASSLPTAAGLPTLIGTIAPQLLLAVSAGSVFMGANTYIGNAPNFMVRSIAEENGVRMPGFFGYMGWAGRILIPVFIIDTFVFFILLK